MKQPSHEITAIGEARIPKVSIGMAVYNGEPFIRNALDSLLAQTFTDFELIISDNASTDLTQEICMEYLAKCKLIRYFRQTENKGSSCNFNFVLKQAQGEYFMWAAADDIWDSRFIEVLLETLERGPKCVGAMGQIIPVDEWNQPIRDSLSNHDLEANSVYKRLLPLAQFKPGICFYIYGLYHTSIIRKMGIRCYPFLGHHNRFGEYPTLFSIASHGIIRTNDKAMHYFRIHTGQASHRHEPIPIALFLELRLLLSIIPSVRKGNGSFRAAVFAISVACYARFKLVLSWGLERVRRRMSTKRGQNG